MLQVLRQAVASAAGGAELVKPVAEGKVFTCTLLYFPFFVLFFPLEFFVLFFLHLLEVRGGVSMMGKEGKCI